MRVAVTGAAGQLGTHLLRRLLAAPGVDEIVALDLREPLFTSSKLRFVQADVRDAGIGKNLGGCDALVHLAFVVAKKAARPLHDDINVNGSRNVFRAALDAGVRRFVYASSIAAYGVVDGHPNPIVESTPRIRQDGFWYAASKFDVEQGLDALEAQHPELAVVRFRPAILVGRRMEHRLGDALRKGVLPDLGAPALPLVWDEDVADAFMLALQKPALRGAFNLCAAEPLPAAELARAAGVRHLRLPPLAVRALQGAENLLAALHLSAPMDPGWMGTRMPALFYSTDKARSAGGGLQWAPRHLTCREVMQRWAQVVPRKPDKQLGRALQLGDHAPLPAQDALTVHLDLIGPGGGDFTLRAEGGVLRVAPGQPRPAGARVEVSAAQLSEQLAGRAEPALGLLIEGDPRAGQLVQALLARVAQSRGARA